MAFDDWMGQLLCDMTPFLEDSGFAHVRAAAEASRPVSGATVIDFAQALAHRRTGAPLATCPPSPSAPSRPRLS